MPASMSAPPRLASLLSVPLAVTIIACSAGSATADATADAVAGPARPAASAAAGGSAAPAAPVAQDWAAPGEELDRPAREVVAAVGRHERARIVAVHAVDGRPEVTVTPVQGRAAARAEVSRIQQDPQAVGVAVDQRVRLSTTTPVDDQFRDLQWGLDRLRAEDVWTHQDAVGATVAVIDTGVVDTHADLAGVVTAGTDFVNPGGDGTADGHGHGTHVAGIIAALADNTIGVAGLARGAQVMPIKALDDDGSGWSSDIAAGIVYAVDHGAQVVNLSLGGPSPDSVTENAVQYAVAHGVVVVAAAGNEGDEGNATSYPAAYPGVIGVGATDDDDSVAAFSNTGSYVDVVAPGVHIASTYYDGTWVYMSGTSMATPFVAATAALVKSAGPATTPAQVSALLETTAIDLGAAGRDDASGYGLVDTYDAVCSVLGCGPAAAGPAPAPAPTASNPAPTPTPTTPAAPVAPVAPVAPPAPRPTSLQFLDRSATVPYGTRTAARMRLVDSAGTGVGGASLRVCVRTGPDRTPRCEQRTTGADGTLRLPLTLRALTTVTAAFAGSAGHDGSLSPELTYRVAPKLLVERGRHALTVTVQPRSRTRVTLQWRSGGTWKEGTTLRTTRRGTVRFTDLAPGTYRVRTAAAAHLVRTTSKGWRLR